MDADHRRKNAAEDFEKLKLKKRAEKKRCKEQYIQRIMKLKQRVMKLKQKY